MMTLAPLAWGAAASCRSYEPCDCEASAGAGGSAAGASGNGATGGGLGSSGQGSLNGGAAGESGGSPGVAGGASPSNGAHAGERSEALAGTGASATEGGGGADSNGPVCEEPFRNCDDSNPNGCETNVQKSISHCGACNRECAGLCIDGDCLKFQVLASDQYSLEGNIALGADYAYLSSKEDSDLRRLLRVSRPKVKDAVAQVETLAPSRLWGQIRAIAVGERLYVSDLGVLVSLDLDGSNLREEPIEVESIAATRGFLYYSSLTTLYRRAETSGAPIEVVGDFPGAASIRLASSEWGLFVAVNYPSESEPAHYDIYDVYAAAEPHWLAVGKGVASQLAASFTDVYLLSTDGGNVELHCVEATGQVSVFVRDARDIADLAALHGAVFATFIQTFRRGLRLYDSIDPPVSFEWETKSLIMLPESTAAGELWFVDPSQAALVKVYPYPQLNP